MIPDTILKDEKEVRPQTFEDIVDSANIVLVDTYPLRLVYGHWFRDTVYRAKRFAKLDAAMLYGAADELYTVLFRLSNTKIKTVPGVQEELQSISKRVQDKLEYLQEAELDYDSGQSSVHPRVLELTTEGKNSMQEIAWVYQQLVRAATKSIAVKDTDCLSPLMELVLAVTESTNAKRDFNPRYNPDYESRYEDSHKDEQLVATALCLSVMEQTPCAIVSIDSDINRIFRYSIEYLRISGLEGAGMLLKKIEHIPVRSYFIDPKGNPSEQISSSVLLSDPKYPTPYMQQRQPAIETRLAGVNLKQL